PAYAADTTNAAHAAAGNVVAIEIVVVVDVDVAATPTAPPTPTAAPPRSHHNSGAEGECRACSVAPGRIGNGGIRIRRLAVDGYRIIRGHVKNFRIGGFNHNDVLIFDDLRFYRLLLRGLECSLVLRRLAHALNSIHHGTFLREKCVAEIGGP